MKSITLKCKIITPLIISGADRNEVELREQSFKGILRWWFRFYKGASLRINELKEAEGEIWGSQDLASKIRIIIKNKKLSYQKNKEDYFAYLCMNDSRKNYSRIKRKAFVEGQNFEVVFKVLDPYFQQINKELENTLFFLSNFGGLGARWRRGFGSIMINNFLPQGNNLEEISKYIQNKLSGFSVSENNNFMNLSNTSVYLASPINNFWDSWETAMDELRDAFYRRLKSELRINKIAKGSPREVSPLIIQIKKINNKYYGVVIIWKKWEKYNECVEKIKNLNFKIKEVKV